MSLHDLMTGPKLESVQPQCSGLRVKVLVVGVWALMRGISSSKDFLGASYLLAVSREGRNGSL